MIKLVEIVLFYLEKLYKNPVCNLIYNEPYELLFAARLSAQCTDKRVNIVTRELFFKYKTLKSFADASILDVENIIMTCGLFRTKAFDIVNCAKMIYYDYNGILPDTMEELLKLPGIGRKTANLILGDIYNKPAIVVDTHCKRICNRLGITKYNDPKKIEMELRKIIPPEKSNEFCHRLVIFGREICKAKNPQCHICGLTEYCLEFNKTECKTGSNL